MFGKQNRFYEKIPGGTDVLITHCPPYGILDFDLDRNWGSEELLAAVTKLSPHAHLFGHIHKSHGIEQLGSTIFSNEDYTNFRLLKLFYFKNLKVVLNFETSKIYF